MDEIQQKLDQLMSIDNIHEKIDSSSLTTVNMVQKLLSDPSKHQILQQQQKSITELLDSFLNSNTTQKFQNFIPQPQSLSPTHKPSLDSSKAPEPLPFDMFIPDSNDPETLRTALQNAYNTALELHKLADYRLNLNRQARKILEKSEVEGAGLREVLRFLLGPRANAVFEACARGESGVEILQQEKMALSELSEVGEIGAETTFIETKKERKGQNLSNSSTLRKKVLASSGQRERESEYQKLLRMVNLK